MLIIPAFLVLFSIFGTTMGMSAEVMIFVPIGITLDERIADGYYYSGTVALVQELLAHPELLELPADTPVEYAIRR